MTRRREGRQAPGRDFRLCAGGRYFYRVRRQPMMPSLQVVVAHKGAREHFLAARALHRRGMLARLVTDWYSPASPAWARRLRVLGRDASRALGAASDELPRSCVRALNGFGLQSRWRLKRAERAGRLVDAFAADDRAFAERVARLKLPPHHVFLGFSYAALEALRAEKARGVWTVVDQIDPGRVEWDLVAEETDRWPHYADPPGPAPAGYYERAEAEWREADCILVNSDWSRDALVRRGAPVERIRVLPLAYEPSAAPPIERPRDSGPLTVLWLGSVIIRKGIQYLVEAARLLQGEPVRFQVAGPIGIRDEAIRSAPASIEWMGPVPRSEAEQMFRRADVFVLPTLSDGFAITQVEALAHGLPVIATPNCGAVVEEGRTGFIVPPRDPQALASAVMQFVRNRDLSAAMRPACLAAASRFRIDAYADCLVEILERGMASRRGGVAG